jgi:hypothetical protein
MIYVAGWNQVSTTCYVNEDGDYLILEKNKWYLVDSETGAKINVDLILNNPVAKSNIPIDYTKIETDGGTW